MLRVLRLPIACACALVVVGAPAAARAATATSAPQVVSFGAAPAAASSCRRASALRVSCPSAGGVVTLTVRVSGAQRCTFFTRPDPASVLIPWKDVSCGAGLVRVVARVPGNDDQSTLTVGYVVLARARSGATAIRKLVVSVEAQPVDDPPTVTTSPEPLTPDSTESENWSGYWIGGGPFTAVRGSFNVPNVAPSSDETDTSEWIGIDGASNDDLIQAGVSEDYDPATGRILVYPWWEILPAPATPIRTLRVSQGDRVTIAISRVAGTTWEIDVSDDTTGQVSRTTHDYDGAAVSAEWIVEAATSGDTNNVLTLGQFTPNVTFTNDAFSGPETSITSVSMVQGGVTVATPSPLNGSNGFTVAYGSTAPPAP